MTSAVRSAFIGAVLIVLGALPGATRPVDAQALPGPADSTRARARAQLQRFEAYMGEAWKAEGEVPGAGRFTAMRTFAFTLDSAWVRVDQTMKMDAGTTIAETMFIGWDPVELRIRVWSFASDGSYSDGYQVQGEDPSRWIAEGRTFGSRSHEWRITMFPFEQDAFSLLIEVRAGRDFSPALTLAFRR